MNKLCLEQEKRCITRVPCIVRPAGAWEYIVSAWQYMEKVKIDFTELCEGIIVCKTNVYPEETLNLVRLIVLVTAKTALY